MFEAIRNKYLYNKTQIVEVDKLGKVIASDDLIYFIEKNTPIENFHPFFETLKTLLANKEEEYTFNCVHLEVDAKIRTVDVFLNTGNDKVNPIIIFYDFTDHYNNFQNIAQEKNESILSFHLEELKNQQLEAEKNFKNKFLANVSHDLKTPISASIWFAGMLEKTVLTDAQREIAVLLKETISHIKDLVDDILDLSKIEMGEIKIHESSFDFFDTLHHIESIILPKIKAKDLVFKVNKDPNLPQFFTGDKTRIVQIIINLLDNAVKFTKVGTITLSIAVKESLDNKSVIQIKVADTGTGIKSGSKEEAFQSFKKLHNSDTIEGSGLGLSIVSNLVRLMGGTVDFESELNVGTVFTIELPLKVNETLLNEPKAFEYIKLSKNYDILIVEDEEISQLILMKLLLNHGGFNIKIANNGLQALEIIQQQPFKLIFMDKEMPQMDGVKATSIIRSHPNPNISEIPIIGVSGHPMKCNSIESREMGFDGYVMKPFNKEEIFETIYEVLKIKKS
ncbi:ATP-binding protein [Flavobacterium sp. SUN046]|uniref:hybrid sensor histidine kinase/response regulator n=1 Tax=Flavobacterium sp. SUN046 TaxID=3002440 RepID=UPI002DB9C907|nr:ATP-binding protein [Flavobacterium sp. SUN046]MEC4047882.1 ATP-binding protein [Flavobacterium sp. SUN046]